MSDRTEAPREITVEHDERKHRVCRRARSSVKSISGHSIGTQPRQWRA